MIKFIKSRVNNSKDNPDKACLTQIIRVIQSVRDTNEIIHEPSVTSDLNILLSISRDKAYKELAKSMFYNRSFAHINAVVQAYQRTTGTTMSTFINTTFSRNAFIIINFLMYARTPADYFAFVLKKSMKGLGTHELLLTSAILMRCEVDMTLVKRIFELNNGDTLRNWIRDDTSGYYKYALYKLIGEERSRC